MGGRKIPVRHPRVARFDIIEPPQNVRALLVIQDIAPSLLQQVGVWKMEQIADSDFLKV